MEPTTLIASTVAAAEPATTAVVPVAATGTNSVLTSISSSLTNMGTSAKAFALTHPVGIAAVGGLILGLGAYYLVTQVIGKKQVIQPTMTTA